MPRPFLPPLAAAIALTAVAAPGFAVAQNGSGSNAAANTASACAGRLSVTGQGEASAAPDLLRVNLRTETEAASPAEALSGTAAQAQAMLDALKAEGIEGANVQTSEVSLHPVREPAQKGQAPKVVAWRAANGLRVSLVDVSRFGAVVNAAAAAGATEVSGISLEVSEPDALMEEARAGAVRDAMDRAAAMAEAAGLRLGEVLEMSDGGGGGMPRPMFARAASAMEDMPIAEGEQTLSASVNMTFELCR
ncbi:MAG: hypothetical protein CML46_13825 [Rhodobacteraceae bacterium]|nr:hypothetical protein [Paracoccaceae bacterium]MBR28007.1 hypothetical protein [Paracoccaceae bacterium]